MHVPTVKLVISQNPQHRPVTLALLDAPLATVLPPARPVKLALDSKITLVLPAQSIPLPLEEPTIALPAPLVPSLNLKLLIVVNARLGVLPAPTFLFARAALPALDFLTIPAHNVLPTSSQLVELMAVLPAMLASSLLLALLSA